MYIYKTVTYESFLTKEYKNHKKEYEIKINATAQSQEDAINYIIKIQDLTEKMLNYYGEQGWEYWTTIASPLKSIRWLATQNITSSNTLLQKGWAAAVADVKGVLKENISGDDLGNVAHIIIFRKKIDDKYKNNEEFNEQNKLYGKVDEQTQKQLHSSVPQEIVNKDISKYTNVEFLGDNEIKKIRELAQKVGVNELAILKTYKVDSLKRVPLEKNDEIISRLHAKQTELEKNETLKNIDQLKKENEEIQRRIELIKNEDQDKIDDADLELVKTQIAPSLIKLQNLGYSIHNSKITKSIKCWELVFVKTGVTCELKSIKELQDFANSFE